MIFLKSLFIVIEVLCCLLLITIVLLQKGKDGGLGMAFGAGAGESLFGARAGNVLSKATVILGIAFMANTLWLGILFSHQDKALMDTVPVSSQQPSSMQSEPMAPVELVIPTEETAVPQEAM